MARQRANENRPKALLRFYAISAAIVLTVAVIVAGYANRNRIRLKLASVHASMPPKAAQAEALTRRSEHALGVAAPWVLSALPECLRQVNEYSGTREFAASKLPPGYARLAPGATLQFADCALEVESNAVLVRRGKDRFYVPAPAELYEKGSSVALMHQAGARAVLRLYEPAPSTY